MPKAIDRALLGFVALMLALLIYDIAFKRDMRHTYETCRAGPHPMTCLPGPSKRDD